MSESLIVIRGPIGVGKTSVSKALRDTMPDRASCVKPDALKLMIDPNNSSDWRRQVANDTAGFLTGQLLEVPRTAIVEAHTKYPEEIERYAKIANSHRVPLVNVLLTAPIDVCMERANGRDMTGIGYPIDEEMIRDYYQNLTALPGELELQTGRMGIEEAVFLIQERIADIQF